MQTDRARLVLPLPHGPFNQFVLPIPTGPVAPPRSMKKQSLRNAMKQNATKKSTGCFDTRAGRA